MIVSMGLSSFCENAVIPKVKTQQSVLAKKFHFSFLDRRVF